MTKLLKQKFANRFLWRFADESDGYNPNLYEFSKILRDIRPGDVLLIEGRSLFSRLIKLFTRSQWTHCALYIGHSRKVPRDPYNPICTESDPQSEGAWLIEANLGEGVVASPLEKYARHHIQICRPKDLSIRARQKVITNAIACLDGKYDLLLILRLAAFLMARWIFPVSDGMHRHPFSRDSTRVICTGLIWRSFDPVRIVAFPFASRIDSDQDRLDKGTSLLTPNIFLHSPNFQVVNPPELLPGWRNVAA